MTKPSKQPPIICIGDIWEVGDPRLWLKLRPSGAVEIPPTLRGTGFVHIEPSREIWKSPYRPAEKDVFWVLIDGRVGYLTLSAFYMLADPQMIYERSNPRKPMVEDDK